MPLIVFEGIDGSGTTTHATSLYADLRTAKPVVLTSQPTKGPIGKFVRSIFEGKVQAELPSWKQMLYLFQADREGHAKQLREWLEEGNLVICDRYWMSSLTYQVASAEQEGANGMQVADWIARLNEDMPQPAVTFVLDVSVPEALRRKGESGDLFQKQEILERVRELYQQVDAERIVRLDTEKLSIGETEQAIERTLDEYGLL